MTHCDSGGESCVSGHFTSPTDSNRRGAGFWSDKTWRVLTEATAPVLPFDLGKIEEAKYLLSIGSEVFISSPDAKNTVRQLKEDESFAIDPGQFAFILTHEKVTIPFDCIGFISIRASVKFGGLVNISGFHVDPGYSGKLVFSVFNAGPSRIHLRRGEGTFPLWMSYLDQEIENKVIKSGYTNIPSKLVNPISGDFTTAYQLAEQIKIIKSDIADLKAFKGYAVGIAALALLVLSPYIKATLEKILSTSNDPAVILQGVPPDLQPRR